MEATAVVANFRREHSLSLLVAQKPGWASTTLSTPYIPFLDVVFCRSRFIRA